MPIFKAREREKIVMEVAKIMLPVIYEGHASNFTRKDDGGYADYVAAECFRVSEAFVAALETRP